LFNFIIRREWTEGIQVGGRKGKGNCPVLVDKLRPQEDSNEYFKDKSVEEGSRGKIDFNRGGSAMERRKKAGSEKGYVECRSINSDKDRRPK